MPIHKDAEDVRCYLEMKCIAEKVLHASAVDERDDLDGWHVVRDTEQIKQRWVNGLASTLGFDQRVLWLAWPLSAHEENTSNSRQRAFNALE